MTHTMETRKAAEARIRRKGRARELRVRIHGLLSDGMERIGSDIASILGEPILSIRPRLTEMRDDGLIEACGKGRNANGNMEAKWRTIK